MLVLWYGGSLVNKHELDVGILTGNKPTLVLLLVLVLLVQFLNCKLPLNTLFMTSVSIVHSFFFPFQLSCCILLMWPCLLPSFRLCMVTSCRFLDNFNMLSCYCCTKLKWSHKDQFLQRKAKPLLCTTAMQNRT